MIDINDFQSVYYLEKNADVLHKSSQIYGKMVDEAVCALSRAKEYHDMVEKMYARTMNFEKIDALAESTVESILAEE